MHDTINQANMNNSSQPHGMTLAQSRRQLDSADLLSGGALSSKELMPLVKLLAQRLSIPELMAFKMIRKFMGTGRATSFSDIKNFLTDYIKSGNFDEPVVREKIFTQLNKPEVQTQADKEIEAILKPLFQEMGDKFAESRQQTVRAETSKLFSKDIPFVPVNPQVPVTELVTSPKAFASWLVNNRAAFIALKSNPQLTYLLMALANPNVQKSPILLAEIAKLITQVIKMRRGKSQVEDVDDETKESLDKMATQEAYEHEQNIVNSVKAAFEGMGLQPLRDFLIEAERFAEEEMAHLWSLTLKKEKELEKELSKNFEKFKAKQKRK